MVMIMTTTTMMTMTMTMTMTMMMVMIRTSSVLDKKYHLSSHKSVFKHKEHKYEYSFYVNLQSFHDHLPHQIVLDNLMIYHI